MKHTPVLVVRGGGHGVRGPPELRLLVIILSVSPEGPQVLTRSQAVWGCGGPPTRGALSELPCPG